MMNKAEFFENVKNLSEIKSKTGRAIYNNFSLNGNTLTFNRVEMGTVWLLDLLQLFELYLKEHYFDTSVIKTNLKQRTNSPSLAILIAIGACDYNGYRIQ